MAFLSATVPAQELDFVPPPPSARGQSTSADSAVEPALVPEGVLATNLMETLKIGQAPDEAQAETMLSDIGIEPKNGWIADYPVTPSVMDEIEQTVRNAAGAGKLGMSADEALKLLGRLKTTLGLDRDKGLAAPPAPRTAPANRIIYKYLDRTGITHLTDDLDSVPEEYRSQVQKLPEKPLPQSSGTSSDDTGSAVSRALPTPSPELLDAYYAEEGPPVVTYYPPPEPYGYLYDWIPYSFWSSGFLYPGFFILRDFHRHVHFGGKPFLVTNHIGFGYSRRGFRVDPDRHGIQPQLTQPPTSPQVFASPTVQSNARAIIANDQSRLAGSPVQNFPVTALAPRPSPGTPRGFIAAPRPLPTMGNRGWGYPASSPQAGAPSVMPPSFHGRSFLQFPTPSFRPPAFPQGGGNFQGGFPKSGGGFGGFHGGGGFGGFHGSFGGGARGGHR